MSLDMQQTGYSLRTEQMKIMVSACLIGEKCKYNGKDNYSKELEQFIKGHDVIAVCPEVRARMLSLEKAQRSVLKERLMKK